MIVIPDLFGSYQKGREEAIKNNWNDLAQYESIESSRHQNDAQALANLATMADFGKKRRLTDNEVTNSDLNTAYNQVAQIGKLYNAKTNNLLGEINYNTLGSNVPLLYDAAASNLNAWYNTGRTNENNSITNYVNSDILRYVTESTYPETRQAAYKTQVAKNDIAVLTAMYGPKTTENLLKAGLIDSGTKVQQSQTNNVVTGINAIYAPDIAHLTNQGAVENAYAAISQGKLSRKTFETAVAQYDDKTQAEIFSSLVSLAEQSGDVEGANRYRQLMGGAYTKMLKSAGFTGSVPIINAATGQKMGDLNNNGTVSRTADTGTSGTGGTSSAGNTARGATATTPTAVVSNNLFGMPVFMQRQPYSNTNVVRQLGNNGPWVQVPVYNQGSRNPTATDYAGWWGAY